MASVKTRSVRLNVALAPTLEAHHPLDDALALLGHHLLLADSAGAVLTDFASLSTHLDGHESVDLVVAFLASRHVAQITTSP